ncbi:hypothetical protein [Haloechinothrix sp. LS1_15]|uniref:hypothetical protein n=1 Tax=Haloechinothrix sp. LS1_15 TaxID=2652248 RepID=UPI0029454D17|nr:hypothetical protein [Haloechinothrix sp. LS1_15]MDV6011527.1 hypothetical protein [Haloechinothrix sp. LS1_15]
MIKKAGFVAATAAGLMMLGGTAAAVPADAVDEPHVGDGNITYEQAFHQFNEGGGAAGYGAASLVSSAYTGVALTPALVADSLSN